MTPNTIEEQEPDQALEHKTEIAGAGPEKHELGACKQNRERWNSRTAPEIAHSEERDRSRKTPSMQNEDGQSISPAQTEDQKRVLGMVAAETGRKNRDVRD
jgi:hypothetical protein